MTISAELTQELVTFLQQQLNDKNYCRAKLILLFGAGNTIVNNINWDTALSNIIPIMIERLDGYGRLNGEIVLCGFLRLIGEDLGEDFQERIRQLVQKIQGANSENLYHSLSKLNFSKQDKIFYELIKASSIAAFLIHGEPEYGQKWLLNRLVHKYCPNSVKSKNVQINIGSLVKKNDMNSLLRELARKLGLQGKQCTLSEIVKGINKWLESQNVLLILSQVGIVPETNLIELMKNFWEPLSSEIKNFQSQPNEYKLFMFLIDDIGYVKSWNNTNIFAETLNCDWKPQTPIKAPEITALLRDDLDDWIRYEYNSLPSQLKKPCVPQIILENSENGVPEQVLYQICAHCGYDWYEESTNWLKL